MAAHLITVANSEFEIMRLAPKRISGDIKDKLGVAYICWKWAVGASYQIWWSVYDSRTF